MKKNLILLIILLYGSSVAIAQQKPLMSQYMMNYYLINPASSGIDDNWDINTSYRSQWVGLEGAPKTYYVSAHTSVGKLKEYALPGRVRNGRIVREPQRKPLRSRTLEPHHGLGGFVMSDHTGLLSNLTANVTYAYHFPITKDIRLSFGAAAGVSQYTLNINGMRFNNNSQTDPILTNKELAKENYNPDINLGLWLYTKKYFLGMSTVQFLESRFLAKAKIVELGDRRIPHFYATAGYNMPINKELTLIPSFMLKMTQPFTKTNMVSVDLNVKVNYDEFLWGGVSYRHNDAVSAMMGAYVGMFAFGYSYDFTTNELSTASNGSHEVLVGLRLGYFSRIISPQFFW